MVKKLVFIIFLVLSMCAISYGQSDFQGITPGTSKRREVEGVFGLPIRAINATHFEYKAPDGIAKLEVEYRASPYDADSFRSMRDRIPVEHRAGAAAVERIEVFFIRPVSRAALIKKFNLSQKADATGKNSDEKLVEYFGGSSLLDFTYASGDVSSGVSQMGYCSRQLLARVSGVDVPSNLSQKREGAIRPMQMENEISLDGTNLTYYSRSFVDQCKADCENNLMCKGFTWIKEGTYNPGDSAMCYLLSAVTRKNPARGHVSAVKE